MKKIRNMLMMLLCAVMLATATGCANQPATQATNSHRSCGFHSGG